ncbi:MAG TPA: hypothetical protein VHU84_08210 [Lacipirellulaceae bacterium]|nr:hypothetical protein [Lacipirellulaceae bacterium]
MLAAAMVDELLAEQPSTRPTSFRFGLKTIFVVMTILCLWFGYQAIHHQRFEQMRARQSALVKAVQDSMNEAPSGTHIAPRSGPARWSGRNESRDRIRTAVTTTIPLRIDPPFNIQSNDAIANELLDDYGRRLIEIGLKPDDLGNFADPDTYRRAWQLPEYGVLVLFEIRMTTVPNTKQAVVTSILIHNENVWP